MHPLLLASNDVKSSATRQGRWVLLDKTCQVERETQQCGPAATSQVGAKRLEHGIAAVASAAHEESRKGKPNQKGTLQRQSKDGRSTGSRWNHSGPNAAA